MFLTWFGLAKRIDSNFFHRHRRGRLETVSSEDELDNLQQLSDMQLAATTTPSSSDPSVVGMIQKIMFNFTYDKCVYIC